MDNYQLWPFPEQPAVTPNDAVNGNSGIDDLPPRAAEIPKDTPSGNTYNGLPLGEHSQALQDFLDEEDARRNHRLIARLSIPNLEPVGRLVSNLISRANKPGRFDGLIQTLNEVYAGEPRKNPIKAKEPVTLRIRQPRPNILARRDQLYYRGRELVMSGGSRRGPLWKGPGRFVLVSGGLVTVSSLFAAVGYEAAHSIGVETVQADQAAGHQGTGKMQSEPCEGMLGRHEWHCPGGWIVSLNLVMNNAPTSANLHEPDGSDYKGVWLNKEQQLGNYTVKIKTAEGDNGSVESVNFRENQISQ